MVLLIHHETQLCTCRKISLGTLTYVTCQKFMSTKYGQDAKNKAKFSQEGPLYTLAKNAKNNKSCSHSHSVNYSYFLFCTKSLLLTVCFITVLDSLKTITCFPLIFEFPPHRGRNQIYSFHCLLGRPQRPQGCQKMCHYPLNLDLEVWCSNIQPKLKKQWNSTKN